MPDHWLQGLTHCSHTLDTVVTVVVFVVVSGTDVVVVLVENVSDAPLVEGSALVRTDPAVDVQIAGDWVVVVLQGGRVVAVVEVFGS